MKKNNILKLSVSLALPLGIGAIAGMYTSEAVSEWFAALNKPSFSPPNWLFGPVWTMLYILMGISLFLIWKQEPSRQRNRAISVFLVQMALNFAWSFIFFYFNRIGLALIEIMLLWISIILMLLQFYKLKPLAACLNIPYFLWVTFATILNAAYFVLN
jgi:tryptophan-rich sensory protein